MKRIRCMMLSLILCFSCFAVFAADETQDLSILLQIDNPQMSVNGAEKEIDPGRGTTPILQNDRTLLLSVRLWKKWAVLSFGTA